MTCAFHFTEICFISSRLLSITTRCAALQNKTDSSVTVQNRGTLVFEQLCKLIDSDYKMFKSYREKETYLLNSRIDNRFLFLSMLISLISNVSILLVVMTGDEHTPTPNYHAWPQLKTNTHTDISVLRRLVNMLELVLSRPVKPWTKTHTHTHTNLGTI